MNDNQRTQELESELNGEQLQSESPREVPRDSEHHNSLDPHRPVQIINIKSSDNLNLGGNCVLKAKGNRTVQVTHASGTISFSRGRKRKLMKDDIVCIWRNGKCYLRYWTKNRRAKYVKFRMLDMETKCEVGSFRGENGQTGIAEIKNSIAELFHCKWPKECKPERPYLLEASSMNGDKEEIECCHVQPLHITSHTNYTLDPIFQKSKEIAYSLTKEITLNDRALLAICLFASNISDQDSNLVVYLTRCHFDSQDLRELEILKTGISLVKDWSRFLLSQPSNNEIQLKPSMEIVIQTMLRKLRI